MATDVRYFGGNRAIAYPRELKIEIGEAVLRKFQEGMTRLPLAAEAVMRERLASGLVTPNLEWIKRVARDYPPLVQWRRDHQEKASS